MFNNFIYLLSKKVSFNFIIFVLSKMLFKLLRLSTTFSPVVQLPLINWIETVQECEACKWKFGFNNEERLHIL